MIKVKETSELAVRASQHDHLYLDIMCVMSGNGVT